MIIDKIKKNSKLNNLLIILIIIMIMIVFTVMGLYIQQRVINRNETGISSANEDYAYHFVMIMSNSQDEFWTNVYSGALDKAVNNNAYIEFYGNELYSDFTEAELVEIAIASKVDGIIIETDGSAEVNSKIQKARKNGIPVVTLLRDVSLNSRICYVGISNYNIGQEYAYQIASIINEKDKNNSKDIHNIMILMDGSNHDSSQSIIYATIQNILSDRYGLGEKTQIEARTINSESAFDTEEAIRNIFLSEESMPDIILCLNETSTECVYQALVDYNQVGNIELIGYYHNSTILSGIKKEIIYATAGVDTYKMGSNSVEALIDYLLTGYSSDYYSVDTFIIDRNNIDEYYGGDGND